MIYCHALDKRYWSFLRHKGLIHYLLQWNPSCLFVFPLLQNVLLFLSPKLLLPCQHSSWHPMWVACRSCPYRRSAMSLPMPLLYYSFLSYSQLYFSSEDAMFSVETNKGRPTPLGENDPTSRSLSTCHPHLGHVDTFLFHIFICACCRHR